ncbi:MAG: HigA family addiction module antitoxin [bacterium]
MNGNKNDSEDYFVEAPPHPGEILKHDFLVPLELTQTELADRLDIPYPRVNEIVNGKRGVTPETAVLLEKLFDVSAEFWLNLQRTYDLYEAKQGEAGKKSDNIEPIT